MPSLRSAVPGRTTTPAGPLRSRDPRRVGRFRITGRLGAGAMGAVYLGVDRRGRRAAVKVIREEYTDDPAFRARFRREVDAMSQVRSPWTARLVDADADAALPWMATEFIDGPTASRATGHHGGLPRAAVVDLVAGVARALAEIHAVGLVHRDVKPGNVILGPQGARLIDLGVVGMQDATRLTTTGTPIGTPSCMSPEQAANGVVDSPSDIWSLAALAYFVATGKHLFEGQNAAVLLYQVVYERPDYSDAPGYLLPLLEECLRRDPATRPSAERVLELLGPVEEGAAAAAAVGVPREPAVATPASASGSAGSVPAPAPGSRFSWRGLALPAVVALGALTVSTAGLVAWAPWEQGRAATAVGEQVLHAMEGDAARAVVGGDGAVTAPDPAQPDGDGSGSGTEEPPPDDDAAAPEPADPGTRFFEHAGTAQCLTDVMDGDPVISSCTSTSLWEVLPLADGASRFRHPIDDECLAAGASGTVTSTPCDPSSPPQSWTLITHGTHHNLRNTATGTCLTVLPNKSLTTEPCTPADAQLWTS